MIAAMAPLPVTVSVNRPCYVIRSRTHPLVVITATGLPPDIPVAISDTLGDLHADVMSSAAGRIVVSMREPDPELRHPGVAKDTITVTGDDSDGTAYAGSTDASFSELAVAYGAARARPGLGALAQETTWTFSGFATGETIWGHYTYGARAVARQSFGRPRGACGLLTVRRPLYPARAGHSSYRLQVDDRPGYSPRTEPALRLTLALTTL